MPNGWFPKLNSKGDVVSGAGVIDYNGLPVASPGWHPEFKTDNVIVYIGEGDCLYELEVGKQPVKLSEQKVSFFAAGAGKVAFPQPGDIGLSIDPITGAVARLVEHNGSNVDHSILINDVPILKHEPVSNLHIAGGRLVYSLWTGRPHDRGTVGIDKDGRTHNLRVFTTGWEGNPITIETPEGPWLLFMTNSDLRLRPWNSELGYIITTGEDQNFNAYARYIGGNIQVVWNTATGELQKRLFGLHDNKVSVASAVIPTPNPDPNPNPEPEPEPIKMPELPQAVQDIVQQLYTRHLDLARGDDDQRRQLTKMIVEQTVFNFPNDGYCWKASSPNNPPSKDSMARQLDGKLYSWDLFNGANRKPIINPPTDDITGQHAIVLAGVNHLGAPEPKPEPEPVPVPNPTLELKARMTALEATFTALNESNTRMQEAVGNMLAAVTNMEEKVEALAARRFRVKGKTGSKALHVHDVDLEVVGE